jgi:ribonuclease H-related protein
MRIVEAWVDGSFNKNTNYYGWAYAIKQDDKFITDCGIDNRASDIWNVAGELTAVMHLVYNNTIAGYDMLFIIHHDYQGISSWAEGKWKTKNNWTKKYKEVIDHYRLLGVKFKFIKVKGHSGEYGNELVDGLAKSACCK